MSYVFTPQQQAEIDVLVNEITALETTLATLQANLTTQEADWQTLRTYVQNQSKQRIWDDVDINPETGKTAWGEEQDRRIAVNNILTTYSIPQIYLPDILCGIPEVYGNRRPDIETAILGTTRNDLATTLTDIATKKDQLEQYFEDLTGIDPLD
jgi:hypothetical protein